MIEDNNFKINKMKMFKFTQEQINELYKEHINKPFFSNLSRYILSGPVVGMELSTDGAVIKWRNLLGNSNNLNRSY